MLDPWFANTKTYVNSVITSISSYLKEKEEQSKGCSCLKRTQPLEFRVDLESNRSHWLQYHQQQQRQQQQRQWRRRQQQQHLILTLIMMMLVYLNDYHHNFILKCQYLQ